tara:strand:- start:623 stop:1255 length:633 start_codon:yes stop_codon:yes gene_type:complete
MNHYYQKDKLEVGIDESGRGSLFGPVFVAAVIMNDIRDNPPPYDIKDSKKCSEKQRKALKQYIIENSICYNVQSIDNTIIDKNNILNATIDGMHKCLDNITSILNIDNILVDGTIFYPYKNINHICIPKGDNKYINIAAASILAKEYRDEYILQLCKDNPLLLDYDINNNKGYGTKNHITSIEKLGITKWHRKSFKSCNYFNIDNLNIND